MKTIDLIGAIGAETFFATMSFGHDGPRVWIDTVDGGVVTLTSDNDSAPTTYTPLRLFTTDLEELLGVYTTDLPGYEVRRDGGSVPAETTFGFNIVGPLLYFDDVTETFVTVQDLFGPPQPGPVPQVAILLDSEIRVTNEGTVSGFDFYTYHATADHAHLTDTFLGDGSTASDGPSGVHTLPLQLTSAGLTSSETYYLLMGKDVAQDDPLFEEAVAVAQATLVGGPVPGDMNGDGTVDDADVEPFVAVLLGLDSDPDHLTVADVNGDENADGADIGPLLEAMLTS